MALSENALLGKVVAMLQRENRRLEKLDSQQSRGSDHFVHLDKMVRCNKALVYEIKRKKPL